MFYNNAIATLVTCIIGGIMGNEEYRQKIITLIEKTERTDILKYLYAFTKKLIEKWG